jgi:hypothetical protein
MAIARKKENPQITSGTEVVFREVVKDERDLRRKYDKRQSTAQQYRADSGDPLTFRLYITANARNTVDTYFNFRQRMNGWVKDRIQEDEAAPRKFKRLDNYWKSELQRDKARDETRFLFDIDHPAEAERDQLVHDLTEHTDVILTQETPNGWHVLTEPFNYNDLDTDIDYELKTDGMLFVTYLHQTHSGEGDTE